MGIVMMKIRKIMKMKMKIKAKVKMKMMKNKILMRWRKRKLSMMNLIDYFLIFYKKR